MALKLGLISFQFETCKGLRYQPNLDYPFKDGEPRPGEGIQPVIQAAFIAIKEAAGQYGSENLKFGHQYLRNINNLLHIGYSIHHSKVEVPDQVQGQTCLMIVAKFYRLEPTCVYKVTLDVEHLPNSALDPNASDVFKGGLSYNEMKNFALGIDEKFHLKGEIELVPIIKRGRTGLPCYLTTSDERLLEYDFEQVLHHTVSQHQDIKIVKSRSLGNMLLLNNQQSTAEGDIQYVHSIIAKDNVSYLNKKVLVLGGGDGSVLTVLLREKAEFVTVVEIDDQVVEACKLQFNPYKPALRDNSGARHKIIISDCKHFLSNCIGKKVKFDIIINDLTIPPRALLYAIGAGASQRDNRWHCIESIFNQSMQCLSKEGLFITRVSGKGNSQSIIEFEKFLGNSQFEFFCDVRHSFVPSLMEVWEFYTIIKKGIKYRSGRCARTSPSSASTPLDPADLLPIEESEEET